MTMPHVRSGERHPCRCCGYLTLTGRPGSYQICQVCQWEDDPAVDWDGPDAVSGPNHVSLHQAQRNFADFGAVSEDCRRLARAPLPHEVPD
jgi:hypothetical protein